jgi:endonuclease/exonuclease/phosphatase family metal-dependent hydrolase
MREWRDPAICVSLTRSVNVSRWKSCSADVQRVHQGYGDELFAPGENTTAIQGNAVLSRLPVVGSQNLLLPSCFDHSKRAEKRAGNRHALIVRVDSGSSGIVSIANAHLEVFGTAQCPRGPNEVFCSDICLKVRRS